MRTRLRHLSAAVVAVGVVLLIAAGSRVPYGSDAETHSMLRLSWRFRGERVERCRKLTPRELEALPAHMRREEICEGRVAPYRLRVTVDDTAVEDRVVRGAGVLEDRPIYIHRELRLAPGAHRLAVRLGRMSGPGDVGRSDAAEARPALELQEEVVLRPGEIVLVTLDSRRERLLLRRADPDGDRDDAHEPVGSRRVERQEPIRDLRRGDQPTTVGRHREAHEPPECAEQGE